MTGTDPRKECVIEKVRGVERVQNLNVLLFGHLNEISIMVDQLALFLLQKKTRKNSVRKVFGR